jgi:hypothetical protein
MVRRVRLGLLAALCVTGCGAAAPAERAPHGVAPAPSHPSPAPAAPRTVAVSAPPAERLPGVQLEPLPESTREHAAFSIVEPRAGEVLTRAEAEGRSVVLSGASGEMLVGLDDHAFRRVPGSKVRLSELLLEDEELAPGPHRVVIVRDLDGGGRQDTWSWFTVSDDAQPSAAPPPPGVVLVSPHGTYNGDKAADGVTIDAFVLGARRPPLLVRVHGAGWSVERRTSGEPLRVRALPSGDIRVEAFELGGGGGTVVPAVGPWATMSRVITVNRDAPRRPGT